MQVSLEIHDDFGYFLCTFFGGMCITCPSYLQSIASSNFRKLYKTLTIEQRKAAQAEIEQLKNNPEVPLQRLIDFLESLKGDI